MGAPQETRTVNSLQPPAQGSQTNAQAPWSNLTELMMMAARHCECNYCQEMVHLTWSRQQISRYVYFTRERERQRAAGRTSRAEARLSFLSRARYEIFYAL